MERYTFVAHADVPELELASFSMQGPRAAHYSADNAALLIPVLNVAPRVIRKVATGGSLFHALRGVSLLRHSDDGVVSTGETFSFVWGDLRVFEDGKPAAEHSIFLRGVVQVPDLTRVRKYLQELIMRGSSQL